MSQGIRRNMDAVENVRDVTAVDLLKLDYLNYKCSLLYYIYFIII